jgi:hypothetical protein
VHDDNEPSLFLADGDAGGLALVCYAGCLYQDIARALNAKGAVIEAARDTTQVPSEHFQLGPYASHWDYRDTQGRVVMRICRWEQPGGKKDMRPLTNTGDGWKWQHHSQPRPLFNLDRLTNDPEKPVIIVEGEKTAVAAQKLFPGYVATTWPGGAAAMRQADWAVLKGRELVLVPDCDAPGKKAMRWVQQQVAKHGATARIIDPLRIEPTLPAGWDLADALAEKRDVSRWLEAASPEATSPMLLWFAALNNVPNQKYLVKNLLLEGSLFVVFGESNSGKTFWILDLALAIASGQPWRERRVQHGFVLYIAGEGAASVRARVAAYRAQNPNVGGGIPFAILTQAVNLMSEDAVTELIKAVQTAEAECGEKCVLIVLDTFARAIPGANENDAQDVGIAVASADRIRLETGACVGFVHHAGKDPTKGARGSSALRAATDTEIFIEGQSGTRIATVSKQRDLETGEPMPFELVAVPIGHDPEDQSVITSCVVRQLDPQAAPTSATFLVRGKAQRQFITAMRVRSKEQSPEHIWSLGDLRQVGREIGLSKGTARSVVDALTASPYMKTCAFGYQFADGRVEG